MILLIIAISVFGILLMRTNSFLIRSISLVLVICVCCTLTYLDMLSAQVEQYRKDRALLDMYLAEPYATLLHYFSKLSEENPEELRKAIYLVSQDNNLELFRDTWLCQDDSYSVFVHDLVTKRSKTNQVLSVAGQTQIEK